MRNLFGATRKEWTAFSALAKEDLLPYIADPTVKMVETSTQKPGSKSPSRILPSGLGAGILAWPSHKATDDLIESWANNRNHGICIIMRYIRAIDIDIPDDPRLVNAICELVSREFGTMPMRTRKNSGKIALIYRMSHDKAIRKARIPTISGDIELLFDKQHLCVAGNNPSGDRYEWPAGIPTLADVPELTYEEVKRLQSLLVEKFAIDNTIIWKELSDLAIADRTVTQIKTDDPILKYLSDHGLIKSVSSSGQVYVHCPWEHEHTSVSEDQTDTVFFPVGVGGKTQPGFKCLHSHCENRTIHNFLDACGYMQDSFPIVKAKPKVPDKPRFEYDTKGRIKTTLNNCRLAIDWPAGTGADVRYDTFQGKLMVHYDDEGTWQPFCDHDYMEIRLRLESKGFYSIPKEMVTDMIKYAGQQRKMDSAQNWLNTLQWDGVPRIGTMATKILGTSDTPYYHAVVNYLMTGLAGRVLVPGLKADMIPVLIGRQGCRKSSFVHALAEDDLVADLDLTQKDADITRKLRGKLVAELPELRGLNSRDAQSIKNWVTISIDEWVPKYQEFAVSYHRRFMAIGTSNEARFLSDPTGERRWLPVYVCTSRPTIDVDWVVRNRPQLWAEAKEMFLKNGLMFQKAEQLAGEYHAMATRIDPWQSIISNWINSQVQYNFTTSELCIRALQLNPQAITPVVVHRIERVMSALCYEMTEKGEWAFTLA